MAQTTSYVTPDLVEKQDDTTMRTSADEPSPTGEKKSVLGKLKEKTRHRTKKLKDKLKPGSGGGDAAAAEESSSSSSSEDEPEAPTNNAFSGMTQPEYERKLNSGELSPQTTGSDRNPTLSSPGNLSTEDFNQRTANDFPPSQGQDDSAALSRQFEGLSTDEKPGGDKFNESTPLDEGVGGKIDRDSTTMDSGVTAKDNILDKAGNPTADDSAVAKDKPDPEGLLSSGNKSPQSPPKTWGQWVGEKVGLAKPSSSPTTTPAATTSETSTDKPVNEKIQDSLIGAKETVAAKTAEATDAAKGIAEENKEAATTTDPQKQTYTQKLTGAIYGAKDSLMSSTHPGDEDKALSQKVTETVSNLPTTIKSTLRLGGNKSTTTTPAGARSPTTTPTLDTPVPTEESPSAPAESSGIMSRITGSVTSLFGKKHPTDSTTTTVDSTEPTSGEPTSETATTQSETRAQ